VSRARGGHLASALTLLAAGLGCTSTGVNPNPGLPPTGGGGTSGGGTVHPPSGDVVVGIGLPMRSDPPPMFRSASLVDVVASVSIANGTDFVDGTSVRVTVTREGSTAILESGQLVLDSGDSYAGRISLGDLQSDTYTLTVTARSSGGAVGSDSMTFLIDAGPVISVTSPVEGRSYKRTLTIEVVASDPFGLMGAPTATVGSIPVTLDPSGVDDTFRGTIDFEAHDPPLFGDQLLTVRAVNNNGKRTEVQVVFFIDNEGPLITGTTPTPGEIIGQVIAVSAIVSDNAGVLDSSVIAVIGDETGTPLFELPLTPRGGGLYSILFDSARLTRCPEPPATDLCIVFPTVSFRASDLVGNETVIGYDFAVDNIAPVADLDPPNLRDTDQDRVLRCSHEFDPLGVDNFAGDMPNDLKMAPQVFDLRARIQDDGNRATGLKLTPHSLVDPRETSVFIMSNKGQPLIVDTDGNGSCDSINPLLVPTTQPPTQNDQVLKVRLAPVPPGGGADFTPDSTLPLAYCENGLAPEKPEPMCTFAQPTIAIRYDFTEPAIWSVEPIDDLHCHGNQFDAKANHIEDGAWACIAVGTRDNAGNFSVSRALRVYIDYDYNGQPATFGANPPASAGPAPSCTGIFDKATNTVSPGACTTRRFNRNLTNGEGYLCFRGDCSCYRGDCS
jgi:hypothetical protein